MTAAAQLKKEDQNLVYAQESTEKAKPVAVDADSKKLAQSGRLTPEERIAAIKYLLAEEIEKEKLNTAKEPTPRFYTTSVETPVGKITISAENSGKNDFVPGLSMVSMYEVFKKELPQPSETALVRTGEILPDGNVNKYQTHLIKITERALFPKIPHTGDVAERMVDGLIKDALEAKRSAPK